jgi:hypothetical protein
MSAKARLRWALAAVVLGLFGASLAMLWNGGRAVVSGAMEEGGLAAIFSEGGPVGGVSSRPVTVSGSGRVLMDVVDLDGQPITEGTVVLSCLRGGEVHRIEEGAVRIDDEGHVEGPGCREKVCAELMHTSHVPAEPWVVRPGALQTVVARPLPRLHGEVIDEHGQPVPAATVFFVPPADADPMAMLPLMTRSTSTDADGTFSVAWIERPPCGPCEAARGECDGRVLPIYDEVIVAVRADGFSPTEALIDVPGSWDSRVAPGASPDAPLSIRLAPSEGVLSGRLTDHAGRPYPRAYVLARSTQRTYEQLRADVVDDVFEIEGLGKGPYDLRALQDGVELASLGGARAGDTVELVGEPRADGPDLILRLRVDGRPAEGIVVDGGPFREARTDMQGEVRASRVLPGSFRVRARGPGRRPSVHEVAVETPAEGVAAEQVFGFELPSPRSASRG